MNVHYYIVDYVHLSKYMLIYTQDFYIGPAPGRTNIS